MNIKSILLSCSLLTPITGVFAEEIDTAVNKNALFSHLNFGFLGSYTDFNFDSTVGNNYNRFSGYSQLYSIGAGNIQLAPSLIAGLSLFKVKTNTHTNLSIDPGIPVSSIQNIHNDSISGHVLKQINSSFIVDLAGAYGQNKVNTQVNLLPGTVAERVGYAKTHNNNWLATLTGLYTKPWKKFLLSANGRLLYSQIDAGRYQFDFQSALPSQVVLPLTNKALFLMENIEVGYMIDSVKNPFTPFVNAGLFQVLSYSNSRPVVSVLLNGISPQLNLDKNGYRVGGGITFHHKQFMARIEEQYYNASKTYQSYQTLLVIKYTT